MSQRWSISGVMDHVNRKLFWFEKKTHKELTRTVSVAKSEVGWHLSGEDEQWKCQVSPGPGRSQVSLALDLVLLPVRRTALASPAVAGCQRAAKRMKRKRRRKKRLQGRGDTESPFVGRETFPAVGVCLIIAELSAVVKETIKK